MEILLRFDEIPPDLLEYFEPVPEPGMTDALLLGPEPYAQAHFATFPTAIPDRCIRAGTSERGVCPQCGAPWRRVVERRGYDGAGRADGHVYTANAYVHPQSAPRGPKRNFGEPTSSTTGWQPTCKCKVYKLRDDVPPDVRKFIEERLQACPSL